jgi:hypothetical protein
MAFKWDVLLESLKEPVRIILFAFIAWLLTVIVPQLDVRFIPIATIVLKLIDEYLHESSKVQSKSEQNKGWLGLKGLTNF